MSATARTVLAGTDAGSVGPGIPPRPTLRREWLLLGLSLLVLTGVIAPPLVNLGRYQHRILEAMSRSLGRPVAMRAVSLRLLPAPALVLEDVVVGEQPGFGAEPSLRAPALTAQLRLTSLWRGQLEVSRVTIADASLNLVRNAAGQWDIGSLLVQASHVSNAPTGQRRPGPAPRFPYIEITDSRVNLKQAAEKLPYSLLNANLSVWLAGPEVWQLKLEGQPVRTDVELGLSDTGLLRVEGTLHRGNSLGHMPLALRAEWINSPLGQASRLLAGADPGWRGNLHATVAFTGELDSLAIQSHLVVDDLHREEFTPTEPFSVDTTCTAHWTRPAHLLNQLACRWPVGEGQLLLTGQAATTSSAARSPAPGSQEPDTGTRLLLTADRLPAGFLLAAAGLARSDFSPHFTLDGSFSGPLTYSSRPGSPPTYSGSLDADELRLTAPTLEMPVVLREARLTAATPSPTGMPTLLLTAAPVDLGGPVATALNAQLTPQGLLLHAGGSASVARLIELGRATRLLPRALAWLAPSGMAEFDVTRGASWQPGDSQVESGAGVRSTPALSAASTAPTTPTISGWLRLHAVRYTPPFLADAVLLPAAQAIFTDGSIAWTIPAAVIGPMRLQLTALYPLDCAASGPCPGSFHANVDTLDAADVRAALFGGSDAPTHLLSGWMSSLNRDNAHWPAISGTIHAETLTVGKLALRNADATLSIHNGIAELTGLDAQTFGGTLHASGTLRRDGRTPRYALSTALSHASAASVSSFFHETWGAGTVTASSQLELSGFTAAELANSATGHFKAQWTRGGLGGSSPLSHFSSWTADGDVAGSALTLTHSLLSTAQGAQSRSVNGVVGFDRSLRLEVGSPPLLAPTKSAELPISPAAGAAGVVLLTGTLAHPDS